MYKCTDCGKEYSEKPQYCDCGNIEFEEIKTEPVKIEPVQTQEIKIQPKQAVKPNNNQKKVQAEKKQTDYISVAIFITCIILSILSLIFIRIDKPEQEEQKTEKHVELKQTENIPSINSLWVERKAEPQVVETVEEASNVEQKQPEQPRTQVIKSPVETEKPKAEPKKNTTVQKQEPKQNKTNKSTPTAVKTQKQPAVNTSTQQPKKTTTQPQTQTAAPNQAQNQAQTNTNVKNNNTQAPLPLSIQPAITQQKQPAVDTEKLKKELLNYKIKLRNKITADVNFANIIGDGNCIVSFKIDKNGKLTDRKFIKQSDNDSLNNQVYNAIMNNPGYNPPPEGYKNETLKYSVKIYGKSFEVDLN